MKYRFIREHVGRFAVERMCRILGVSRGGYSHSKQKPHTRFPTVVSRKGGVGWIKERSDESTREGAKW